MNNEAFSDRHAAARGRPAAGGKRNFFQVNIPASDLAEMRKWCRELGIEFRGALRMAVIGMQLDLRKQVQIKRRTGLDDRQQMAMFRPGPPQHN